MANVPLGPWLTPGLLSYWQNYPIHDLDSIRILHAISQDKLLVTHDDIYPDLRQFNSHLELQQAFPYASDDIELFHREQEYLRVLYKDQLAESNRIYIGPDFTKVCVMCTWLHVGQHQTLYGGKYAKYIKSVIAHIYDEGTQSNNLQKLMMQELEKTTKTSIIHVKNRYYFGFFYYVAFYGTPFTCYTNNWKEIYTRNVRIKNPFVKPSAVYGELYEHASPMYNLIPMTSQDTELRSITVKEFRHILMKSDTNIVNSSPINVDAAQTYAESMRKILTPDFTNEEGKKKLYPVVYNILAPTSKNSTNEGFLRLIKLNFIKPGNKAAGWVNHIWEREDKNFTAGYESNTGVPDYPEIKHVQNRGYPQKINQKHTIYFPYKEMNCVQRYYAPEIARAMLLYEPLHLVGPTGSGKTHGILSVIFSMMQYIDYDSIAQRIIKLDTQSETKNPQWKTRKARMPAYDRVIYYTRTVQQIVQVLRAVKAMDHIFTISSAYLVAKFRTCIHPDWERILERELKDAPEAVILARFNDFCAKRSTEWMNNDDVTAYNEKNPKKKMSFIPICDYFLNSYVTDSHGKLTVPSDDIKMFADLPTYENMAVYDIEDLKTHGRECTLCPHACNKYRLKKANFIVGSYTFMSWQDTYRGSFKYNGILVVDEAHNLSNVLTEINACAVVPSQLQTFNTELTTLEGLFEPEHWTPLLSIMSYLSQIFLPGQPMCISETMTTAKYTPYAKPAYEYIPLDVALEKIGISAYHLYIILSTVKQAYFTYYNYKQVFLESLRSLIVLYTEFRDFRTMDENVSSWFITCDNANITPVDVVYANMRYPRIIKLTFKCMDPNRIWTAALFKYNNIFTASGTYDNVQQVCMELSQRYNDANSENIYVQNTRCTNFVNPACHVSSVDNIVVSHIGCALSGNNMELKFTYNTLSGNMLGTSCRYIAEHVMLELQITTKNVLVFLPNKTVALETMKVLVKMHERGIPEPTLIDTDGYSDVSKVHFVLDEPISSKFILEVVSGEHEGRVCIVSYYRSILSEGVDVKSNSLSAIICAGVPFESTLSPELMMTQHLYKRYALLNLDIWKKYAKEEDAMRVECITNENMEYKTWMFELKYKQAARNAILQAMGRLLRNADSTGHLVFLDSRLDESYRPKWMNSDYVTLFPKCNTKKTLKDMYSHVYSQFYKRKR
jgi:Rad3-related DNA helicase